MLLAASRRGRFARRARGRLRPLRPGLTLARATDAPLVDPSYLSTANDMATAVRIIRWTLHVARTPPFATALRPGKVAGMDFFALADRAPEEIPDAEIEAWIRDNAQTVYHPVRGLGPRCGA